MNRREFIFILKLTIEPDGILSHKLDIPYVTNAKILYVNNVYKGKFNFIKYLHVQSNTPVYRQNSPGKGLIGPKGHVAQIDKMARARA